MRFPLKIALTAVLAKGIVAEMAHLPQTQQPNANDLELQYHQGPLEYQQEYQPEYQTEYQNQQQDAKFDQSPTDQHVKPFNYAENHEQPAFDSTKMAYQSYLPPGADPVQQYASQYAYNTNEPDAVKAEPSNEVPSVQYPDGYNPAAYNPAAFNPNQYNPGAFHVQTGYEGYLVPGPPSSAASQKEIVARNPPSFFSPISNSFQAISNSIPNSMRDATSLLSRSFSFLMSLLGITVFGGGLTTALCTFTPLCTISFAIPFLGVRRAVPESAENLIKKSTGEFLTMAIKKFTELNPGEKEKMISKSSPILPDSDIKTVDTKPVDTKINDSKMVTPTATIEKKVVPVEKVEPSEKSEVLDNNNNNTNK